MPKPLWPEQLPEVPRHPLHRHAQLNSTPSQRTPTSSRSCPKSLQMPNTTINCTACQQTPPGKQLPCQRKGRPSRSPSQKHADCSSSCLTSVKNLNILADNIDTWLERAQVIKLARTAEDAVKSVRVSVPPPHQSRMTSPTAAQPPGVPGKVLLRFVC